jgi:hypothetical protein
MSWDQLANLAGSGLLFVTCSVFVVVYQWKAPTWYKSRVGRNMMTAMAAFGLLGLHTLLITVWPSGEMAAVLRTVRTALQVLLSVQIMQRIQMVLEAQRAPENSSTD